MMPLAAAEGSGVPRWLKAGEDRLEPGLQEGGRGGGGVTMMPLAAAVGSGVPRWLKAGEDRLEPGLQERPDTWKINRNYQYRYSKA